MRAGTTRFAIWSAVGAALLCAPSGPAAADPAPAAEERALGDAFLDCSAVAETHAAARATAAERELWEGKRRLFFAAATAFVPASELAARVAASAERFDRWAREGAAQAGAAERALGDCLRRAHDQAPRVEARWAAQREAAWAAATRAGLVVPFHGIRYVHRRSQGDLHEYTPAEETDRDLWTPYLSPAPLPAPDPDRWSRRLTIAVHENVTDGEGLARLAAGVGAELRRAGRVVRAASRPRGDDPAEHDLEVVVQRPGGTEYAFVRVALQEGKGLVAASWVRAPGPTPDAAAAAWLAQHAPEEERALLLREGPPSLAILENVRAEQLELAAVPLRVLEYAPALSAAK